MSYSRANEDAVKTLARAFGEAKRDVWFDHEIDGGDIWWETILKNIRTCSVFVFALSDESVASTACMAEYRYARALRRPILPVLVGHLTDVRAHPLAEIHYVPFRKDDAVTGAVVLSAVDRAATRRVPLPDPLPAQPPIPLPYLDGIRRQVDASPLDPPTQLHIVGQLRRGLAEETEPELRAEIVSILYGLLAKPWRTPEAGFEIRAVLGALAEMEDEIARLSGTDTVQFRRPDYDKAAPNGPAQSFDAVSTFLARYGIHDDTVNPDPPPEEIFRQRMEEISHQMHEGAAVREAAREKPRETPDPYSPTPGFSGVDQNIHGFFDTFDEPETVEAASDPSAEPAETTVPRPEPVGGTTAVPSRRALGVTALVLAVLGGVMAAVIGSVVLAVPFVVAAAAAVVALRFSAQVGRRGRDGDVDGARSASHTARVWGAIALTLVGAVVAFQALQLLTPVQ